MSSLKVTSFIRLSLITALLAALFISSAAFASGSFAAKRFTLPKSPAAPFPKVAYAGLPSAATLVGPVEPYAPYVPQTACNPKDRKGIVAFRRLVMSSFPQTKDWGSVRMCTDDGTSEHLDGRAWDWNADVKDPQQFEAASALLGWLTARVDGVDGYWARRLGIMYIGYNHRIWASYRAAEGWRVLSNSNPHTDHVHFSFSWNGARGKTSFWKGRAYPTDFGPCTVSSKVPAPITSRPNSTPCRYVSLDRSKVLWMGSTGRKVSRFQSKLGLTPTGRFDVLTRKAVMRFQKRSGLVRNGTLDRPTRKALNALP